MKFVIYGAGGVGGVVGAQLHKAGEAVTLVARGAHLDAIRSRGLRYQTPFADEYLPIPAVGHPGELSLDADAVVLLTMKSQHTRDALDVLRATQGDEVAVVCCQNGVSNEREALRRFANVYAMLVYLPVQMTQPGHIVCHATLKSGILDLGCYPNGVDDRCTEIARRFENANLGAKANPAVMRFKYSKLIMNLNNSLDAVAPKGDLANQIKTMMIAEAWACYEAAGIDCATDEEGVARREGNMAAGDIAGVERVGGSSRQSLLRATGDIEADYLNGEIVQLGRLYGVATPANEVLQRLAVECAQHKTAPGSLALDEIYEQVQRRAQACQVSYNMASAGRA